MACLKNGNSENSLQISHYHFDKNTSAIFSCLIINSNITSAQCVYMLRPDLQLPDGFEAGRLLLKLATCSIG